jgi:hypothetical protein
MRERERWVDFCTRVLRMRPGTFGHGGSAFRFGDQKTHVIGPIRSVYVRDSDGHLVEVAEPA